MTMCEDQICPLSVVGGYLLFDFIVQGWKIEVTYNLEIEKCTLPNISFYAYMASNCSLGSWTQGIFGFLACSVSSCKKLEQ